MPGEFQIVTSQSWISRILGSFGGFFLGLFLVPVSIVILFWNEGHFVETYKTLIEGQALVIEAPASEILTANEGKLVHVIGDVDVGDGVTDDDLGISTKAIRLKRIVKIFQWQEHAKSQTEKVMGGSDKTVTTYSYDQTWSENLTPSSEFKDKTGHENPAHVDYESLTLEAPEARVGAFSLQPAHLAKLNRFTPLAITQAPEAASWPEEATLAQGEIYLGADPKSPKIGDIRISFEVVSEKKLSLVARQEGQSFVPYEAQSGGSIEFFESGQHSSAEMFASAQSDNTVFTWVMRIAGILVSIFGFNLIFGPISVIADVIPLVGSLVGFTSGGISILLGAALSAASIGVAWVFFRPLIGGALLAVAIAAVIAVFQIRSKKVEAAH
ncbi:MAG: TMEM43 family protein [Beijerinckiaceae bacterium]|nr:TMEM43 family protein [Beijerinckiaceae bacterium]